MYVNKREYRAFIALSNKPETIMKLSSMSKLLKISSLAVVLGITTLISGCDSDFYRPSHSSSAWHQYDYYPAVGVYYNRGNGNYYYRNRRHGGWVTSRTVPHGYRLNRYRSHRLRMRQRRPYLRNKYHRRKYWRGGRGHGGRRH